MFSIEPQKIYVDLGATRIRVGASADLGSLRLETETPQSTEAIVDAICSMTHKVAAEIQIQPQLVAIASPGLVDESGCIRIAVHLPLSGVNLRERVRACSGIDTLVVNDAKAQALGAAPKSGRLFYICLGSGIGGAFVIDGELYLGSTWSAGEIGHTPVTQSSQHCKCGGNRCIDAISSGFALERRLGGDWWQRTQNDEAKRVLDAAGFEVGHAASLAAILLDLDKVVIGGKITGNRAFTGGIHRGWQKQWSIASLGLIEDTWPLTLKGLSTFCSQWKESDEHF